MKNFSSIEVWTKASALILQQLDKVQNHQLLEQSEPTRRMMAATRPLRLKLAASLIRSGKISDALKFAIFAEFLGQTSKFSVMLARKLQDLGYYHEALLLFGNAIQHASVEAQFNEAAFSLGHCAKIAGHHGLAVNCFALVSGSRAVAENSVSESEKDLGTALSVLTTALSLAHRPKDHEGKIKY